MRARKVSCWWRWTRYLENKSDEIRRNGWHRWRGYNDRSQLYFGLLSAIESSIYEV